MRTYRLDLAIGQRFARRESGVAESIWVLTATPRPQTIIDSVLLTFTEELTQRTFRRSATHVAQEILEGRLISEQYVPTLPTESVTVALTNLLAGMNRTQLRNFQMQVSYVLALDRAKLGLSHKSREFVRLIEVAHLLRITAWKSKAQENPGRAIEPVESKAPAPTTVYRWFLRYRKAGNDLCVLAHSAQVNRTRSPRKPKEKELLMSFLASRMASVETVSTKTLTEDFNRLLATSDPLHMDELIESLHAKAIENAAANKRARTGGKTSMSSKRRKAASAKAKTSLHPLNGKSRPDTPQANVTQLSYPNQLQGIYQ